MKNQYSYTHGNNTFKGAFNIYQARNGSIQLVMNSLNVVLTEQQILGLHIPVINLEDYDHDMYTKFYAETKRPLYESQELMYQVLEHLSAGRNNVDLMKQKLIQAAKNLPLPINGKLSKYN